MYTTSLVYTADITLRYDGETIIDFIERAKRDNLGNWVEINTNKQ